MENQEAETHQGVGPEQRSIQDPKDEHKDVDTVLDNSIKEVMKLEEDIACGEIDVPKPSLSHYVRHIHDIFRSRSSLIITKEELVHKIICLSLDITDSREVEELLEHLLNLVPEWISRNPFSGSYVFRINRTMDVESVVAKLEQS